MANYKPDLSCQSKFIPIDFTAQIIPGTFEHAFAHIIDNNLDLSGLTIGLIMTKAAQPPRLLKENIAVKVL